LRIANPCIMDPLYSIGAKIGIHFACHAGVFAGHFVRSRRPSDLKW
jgi:hypothetical protein